MDRKNLYALGFDLIRELADGGAISIDEFLERIRQRNYDVSKSWVQSFFHLLAEVYNLGRLEDGRLILNSSRAKGSTPKLASFP